MIAPTMTSTKLLEVTLGSSTNLLSRKILLTKFHPLYRHTEYVCASRATGPRHRMLFRSCGSPCWSLLVPAGADCIPSSLPRRPSMRTDSQGCSGRRSARLGWELGMHRSSKPWSSPHMDYAILVLVARAGQQPRHRPGRQVTHGLVSCVLVIGRANPDPPSLARSGLNHLLHGRGA
jgi:hypothetical protein